MKNTKNSGVYKITNIVNGKIYIGSSFDVYARIRSEFLWPTRKQCKTYKGSIFLNAILKYGPKKFKYEIIKFLHRRRYESLKSFNNRLRLFEKKCIFKYKSYDQKIGYNISIETKTCSVTGKNHHWYGKGYLIKGKNNPMYGKHHTQKSKNLMRIHSIGRKVSLKTRKLQSKIRKGVKFSKKWRYHQKLANLGSKNPMYKKVYKNTVNKIINCFNSFSKCFQEMSEKLNIHCYVIEKVLKENNLNGYSRKRGKAIMGERNGRFIDGRCCKKKMQESVYL